MLSLKIVLFSVHVSRSRAFGWLVCSSLPVAELCRRRVLYVKTEGRNSHQPLSQQDNTLSPMSGPSISAASRDYAPGDIILHCPVPLVHVTKYEHRLFTCEQCMAKAKSSILCPACRKVYYCSRECQDRAWERIHKLECPILARHKPLQFESNGIDYMQRLTLRLYLLMANSPEIRTQEFVLHNGETRRLDDMECHANELKDSAQFAGILNYFKLYKIDTFDRDLLLRAYGILHVNSFGIDCYTSEDVNSSAQDVSIEHAGTGLYIEGSVFDHSCVANAAASGDGLALEIRALTDIHKGEQIYIDYLQDVLPREERMAILSERYFFRCQCARGCADGLASPFDCTVDYKRYAVLNRLIDSLLIQDEQEQQSSITQEGKDANQKQKDQSKRNEINWSQLYKCWKQRLRLQECYYATARYHPCLSLFYREYLRFLLVNQHRFNNADDDNNSETTTTTRTTTTTTTASINQQTVGNEPSSSMNNASQQPPPQIEQDLLEFGQKAKQHLTITHGINHSFYSRLFAPNDVSATAAAEPSTSQQAGT